MVLQIFLNHFIGHIPCRPSSYQMGCESRDCTATASLFILGTKLKISV